MLHETRTQAPMPEPPPRGTWRLGVVPRCSGAEGARTPDLLGAIQALSQLSYSPARERNLESAAPTSNPSKLTAAPRPANGTTSTIRSTRYAVATGGGNASGEGVMRRR